MTAVILTFHTLIVLGLIVVVLLQRSDGSALGIGGGGGTGGGFMTGRGAANALTRTTSILAALFFVTSIGLAIRAGSGETDDTIIEELTGQSAPTLEEPAPLSAEDLMGTLGGGQTEADDTAEELSSDLNEAAEAVEGEAGGEAPAAPESEGDPQTDEPSAPESDEQ